jgi:hypothetical protein
MFPSFGFHRPFPWIQGRTCHGSESNLQPLGHRSTIITTAPVQVCCYEVYEAGTNSRCSQGAFRYRLSPKPSNSYCIDVIVLMLCAGLLPCLPYVLGNNAAATAWRRKLEMQQLDGILCSTSCCMRGQGDSAFSLLTCMLVLLQFTSCCSACCMTHTVQGKGCTLHQRPNPKRLHSPSLLASSAKALYTRAQTLYPTLGPKP